MGDLCSSLEDIHAHTVRQGEEQEDQEWSINRKAHSTTAVDSQFLCVPGQPSESPIAEIDAGNGKFLSI